MSKYVEAYQLDLVSSSIYFDTKMIGYISFSAIYGACVGGLGATRLSLKDSGGRI